MEMMVWFTYPVDSVHRVLYGNSVVGNEPGNEPGKLYVKATRAQPCKRVARGTHPCVHLCTVFTYIKRDMYSSLYHPAPSPLPIVFAAELLGVDPPPLETWDTAAPNMTVMARSFWGESKRVRNRKLREVLGWRPLYPTYREG